MQLSRFTDYAIRTLLYAAMHPDRRVTLAEISDYYTISLAHLRKVVHRLGQLHYINTYRGVSGGLTLARPADDINLGKVIAAMEGEEPLLDCAGMQCAVLPFCGLPAVLKRARQAFYAELGQYSLAHVLTKNGRLPRPLDGGMAAPPTGKR